MTLADRWISNRSRRISGSGIRKVVADARVTPGAITLHLGQPDFPVPEAIRNAAAEAVRSGMPATNGYTDTRGYPPLLERIKAHLALDVGWDCALLPGEKQATAAFVTTGTSGGLITAALAMLDAQASQAEEALLMGLVDANVALRGAISAETEPAKAG